MHKQTLLMMVRYNNQWLTQLSRPTKLPCACSKQYRISNQICRSNLLRLLLAAFKTNSPSIKKWRSRQTSPWEKVQLIINKATMKTKMARKRRNHSNEGKINTQR